MVQFPVAESRFHSTTRPPKGLVRGLLILSGAAMASQSPLEAITEP